MFIVRVIRLGILSRIASLKNRFIMCVDRIKLNWDSIANCDNDIIKIIAHNNIFVLRSADWRFKRFIKTEVGIYQYTI